MNIDNTTNSNDYNKSTKELKSQVLADIRKVKDDLTEIKNRLTPGQIIDDAIYYGRDERDPSTTFAYLKSNPVGTSFLTIGTLLLMDDHGTSYEGIIKNKVSDAKDQVSDAYDAAKNKVGQVAEGIKEKFSHSDVTEKVQGLGSEGLDTYQAETGMNVVNNMNEAKEMAKTSLDSVKEKVKSTFQSAKGSVSSASESVKSTVGNVAESVKTKSTDVYEAARNLDPMTYLALGAGLGAITGAALPLSDTESRVLEGGQFVDKMSNFRTDLEQALNQSVNILKNEFFSDVTDFKFNLF